MSRQRPDPTPTAPEPGHESESGDLVQLCSFRIGDEHYVLDIMRIREIDNPLPITPVRRGSRVVDGVIDLRGQILPIVDLRRLLGVPVVPSPGMKHVIVTVAGKLLAVVVDAVGRVIVVPRASIQVSPALLDEQGVRLLPGVVGHQDHLYLLLNLRALLEGGLPGPEALAHIRDVTTGAVPASEPADAQSPAKGSRKRGRKKNQKRSSKGSSA